MTISAPSKFTTFNGALAKNVIVAVEIDGLNDILASGPAGKRLRYGDPVTYGMPGLVYGGITPWTGANGGVVRQYISIQNSALNITQTCEPEQGRSSVSQMQISFIDYQGYMTKLCTPGMVLPDILGRNVKVYLGFAEVSYPEDYIIVFRGVIQSVQTTPGLYTFSIGDPNVLRRQNLFYTAQTYLSAGINSTQTTIPVLSTANFHTPIYDGAGNVDASVTCYITCEDETMSYTLPSAVGATSFTVTRGVNGTSAASHATGQAVNAAIQIGPNVASGGTNPMSLALRLMLSGWDGPYISSQPIAGLGYGSGTSLSSGIFLPAAVDAVRDYGLTPGDFVTVSGDPNAPNNNTFVVTGFQDLSGYTNNVILTTATFTTSSPSVALVAFRSQYDTLPTTCGIGMSPDQVDVAQHVYLQNTFFNGISDNLAFYIDATESSGKQFIESEIYLPIATYSVTSGGQCSVAVVIPPIAGQILQNIDYTNVLAPQSITQTRDVSNRNFFNEIDWSYDVDTTGNFNTFYDYLDATTLGTIGISSVLPITSRGVKSIISGQTVIQERSQRFLGRYKGAATLLSLNTTFAAANTINPGSIVLLTDNGNLKIPSFTTGTTTGQALYEVRNWGLDIKSGQGTLQLLSTSGFLVQDRYGTWAPSSFCAAGSTTTTIILAPSFGALYGANEYQKWTAYVGATLVFHSYDWSQQSTAVLQSVSSANVMTLATALSFTPSTSTIIDFASYPSTGEATEKLIHCFFDRSAPVTATGTSTTFTVSTTDAALFKVGFPISVHNPAWTNGTFPVSGPQIDATITAVNTSTGVVTISYVNTTGYSPAVGDLCEILAFADSGVGYRFV